MRYTICLAAMALVASVLLTGCQGGGDTTASTLTALNTDGQGGLAGLPVLSGPPVGSTTTVVSDPVVPNPVGPVPTTTTTEVVSEPVEPVTAVLTDPTVGSDPPTYEVVAPGTSFGKDPAPLTTPTVTGTTGPLQQDPPSATPELSTIALLVLSVGPLGIARIRRRTKR